MPPRTTPPPPARPAVSLAPRATRTSCRDALERYPGKIESFAEVDLHPTGYCPVDLIRAERADVGWIVDAQLHRQPLDGAWRERDVRQHCRAAYVADAGFQLHLD